MYYQNMYEYYLDKPFNEKFESKKWENEYRKIKITENMIINPRENKCSIKQMTRKIVYIPKLLDILKKIFVFNVSLSLITSISILITFIIDRFNGI
ncbi:MAG: hypothetical protein ACRCVI_02500 [Mycoplasmoidaceae bacterium]